MEPTRLIQDLCRRHGVPREFGERLRPLLERASESPPEKRRRLVELVERSFEEEGRRIRATPSWRDLPGKEASVVRTVASVLHGWTPPLWLRLWEDSRRSTQEE